MVPCRYMSQQEPNLICKPQAKFGEPAEGSVLFNFIFGFGEAVAFYRVCALSTLVCVPVIVWFAF